MSPLLIVGLVIGFLILVGAIVGGLLYYQSRQKVGRVSPVVEMNPPRIPVGENVVLDPATSLGTTDLLPLNLAIQPQIHKLDKSNVFPATLIDPIQSYVEALKAAITQASNGTAAQKAAFEANKTRLVSAVAYLQNIARQITNRNKETSSALQVGYDTAIAQTIKDYFTAT